MGGMRRGWRPFGRWGPGMWGGGWRSSLMEDKNKEQVDQHLPSAKQILDAIGMGGSKGESKDEDKDEDTEEGKSQKSRRRSRNNNNNNNNNNYDRDRDRDDTKTIIWPVWGPGFANWGGMGGSSIGGMGWGWGGFGAGYIPGYRFLTWLQDMIEDDDDNNNNNNNNWRSSLLQLIANQTDKMEQQMQQARQGKGRGQALAQGGGRTGKGRQASLEDAGSVEDEMDLDGLGGDMDMDGMDTSSLLEKIARTGKGRQMADFGDMGDMGGM